MGEPKLFEDRKRFYGVVPEHVDFLRLRLDKSGMTIRALEAGTPTIKRSRLGEILHQDRSKRRAMRLDESQAICAALGISDIEAQFGTELLQESTADGRDPTNIAAILATICDGLGPRIRNVLVGISGLDDADVRPEHGGQLQKLLVESFEKGYLDLVERKGFRLSSVD